MNDIDSSKLITVAMKFNEKINQQDLDGLANLMTEDHTFIDNSGEITKGKKKMITGWKEFFENYPDYKNIFTSVSVINNIVVIVGFSTCSYENLNGPAIWTAKVRDNFVSEWRVYWLY